MLDFTLKGDRHSFKATMWVLSDTQGLSQFGRELFRSERGETRKGLAFETKRSPSKTTKEAEVPPIAYSA